ncbi:MAG: carboxypeptidase regulatory-like domain-containing protein [Candidatus Kapabacteria bacterium]|jgi:hypothetical protein|nr:carboxypeptidase regulatory-like domain-containing protein [Candidatus Kapabacteria bacterium]
MMNTHTAPKLLVHKQDNAKRNDITAAAAIPPQKPYNTTLFNPQDSKYQIHQRKVEKHDLAERELEEDEFEEEEEESETNADLRKQMEIMLRDPKTGKIPLDIGAAEREFVRSIPTRESFATQTKNSSARLQSANYVWQARGPFNVGGCTRVIGIDVSNENVLLAAGVGGGGIWRSTNKGQTWTKATAPQAIDLWALAQDKRPGKQTIWYGGGGAVFKRGIPSGFQGMVKSTDGGQTWQPLASTINNPKFALVRAIVVRHTNTQQDEIYAATGWGIFRSVDGGTTWNQAVEVSGAENDISISSTGVLYAGIGYWNSSTFKSETRFLRSTDGITWDNITPPNFSTKEWMRIKVTPSNPNVFYALSAGNDGTGNVAVFFHKYTYLSGNGAGAGGTWEDRSAVARTFVPGVAGNMGAMLLNVHPQNENLVFIGSLRLARSTDGFKTSVNSALAGYGAHVDYLNMEFFSDHTMLVANDGGIDHSLVTAFQTEVTNKSNWTSLNNGYINTQFHGVALDENTAGSQLLAGGFQDNYCQIGTTSGISSWSMMLGGDGTFAPIGRMGNDRIVYASSQYSTIVRNIVKPDGSVAKYGSGAIRPKNATPQFINPYILDPNNDSVMYYPASTVLWRHNNLYSIPLSGYDQIQGWQQFSLPLSAGSYVSAIAASKGASTRLYLGTSNGKVLRLDNARTGTPTIQDVSVGKGFPAGANVQSCAVDPTDPNKALVVFSNFNVQSLFYTTDGGTIWQPVGGNLEQNSDGSGNGPACFSAVIVNYQGQTTYFVGTDVGLYSTTALNGANTQWLLESGCAPGVQVRFLAKRDLDGTVAVGTYGAGAYTTQLGGAPPVSTVSLTGVVRENSSPLQPVQGVTVTLSNGAQTTTNAAGAYSFANLPKGVYSVTVNFPNGYYATTKTVLKDLSQQSGTQDFLLETIKISGKITVNNVGLANVSVSNGKGLTVLTNAQGDYLFNKVNAGAYTITPTLAGYTFTPTNRAVSISNTPNPPAPTVYGTATAVNFTAQGTLNLSASALTIGPAGVNNAGIMVTANVAWTVASNQAWASVTPTSGNGNGSFSVNVVANPNTTTRTATLTVTGGGVTRTVTITQSGSVPTTLNVSTTAFTAPAAGQNGLSATITSNVAWTASSNQAWATVSPASGTNNGTLTINVAANPNTTQRTAAITITGGGITRTITVTQDAAVAANLQVNPNTLTASAAGQNGLTATITANVAWTASSNQAWVTVTPASGTNNGTLTINVAQNPNTTQRTAAITITGGGITRTITVTQDAAVANTLQVNVTSFNPSAAGIPNFAVTVTSNVAWTASSNQAWVTVTPASGTNNGTLTINIAANPNTTQRTAAITITGGGITRTITVTQDGVALNNLQVSTTAFTVPNGGQNGLSVTVTSNVVWTASSNQAWATVTPVSGTNNGALTINVAANPNTTQRTATITITGGGITRTITVTQNGVVPNNLQVSTTAFTVPNGGQNGLSVTVTSNVAWTASSNQAWATVTPASGTNNGTLTINVAANPNTTQRTAAITITGGGITRTITITQEGVFPILLVNTTTLTVSAAGQNGLTASISANVAWTANSNQAWATVSPASGSFNGTITINASANPNTTQRTATITVSGGDLTKTITLTQSGMQANALTAPVVTMITNLGPSAFTLSWGTVSGAVSYQAMIATDNNFTQNVLNGSGTMTSFAANGLTPGTTYFYRVRAVAADGSFSAWSNVGQYTTPPPAPTAYPPSSISPTSVTVSWSRVTSATRYDVELSQNAAFSPLRASYSTTFGNPLPTTATFSITNPSLPIGSTCYYRVRAYISGVGLPVSAYSTPIAFVIPTLLLTMKTSPNPSSDILRIEADLSEVARESSEAEPVMLRLVDARGSLIQEQYVLSNGKHCTGEFDIHTLQSGTYLVELVFRSDGVTIRRTEKFIKQ